MSRALDFTPEDVAAAVKSLTAAQRRAVSAGALRYGRGYWPLRNGLIERSLMTTANRIPVLTPFGRAVQVELRRSGQ
jgi:hypothetical protein